MNEDILILRMVVNYMAGREEALWAVYEEYVKSRHLYVTIQEILAWKRGGINGRNNTMSGLSAIVEFGA